MQIRAVLSLLVLSLATIGLAQNKMGKTTAEILEMGYPAWEKLFTAKPGISELSVDEASEVFAICMKEKNDADQKKLQKPDADRLAKYRTNYVEFRQTALEMLMTFAGGGTMYSHAWRRGAMSDEELMAKIIPINKTVQPLTTGAKKQKIMDLIGDIRKLAGGHAVVTAAEKKEFEAMHVDHKKGQKLAQKLLRNFDTILPLLPRMRQDECILVLEFYKTWLKFGSD